MKIKFFICLSLSLLVCTEASALTIHNGKIIAHKEWSTENTKGYFHASNISNLSKKTNPLHLNHSDKLDTISMENIVEPVTGTIGTLVPVNASHNIYIHNNSNEPRQYRYTFSLCLWDDNNVFNCTYSQQDVELAPGGDAGNALESNLQYIPKKAGHNIFWASIEVEGLSYTDLGHMDSYTVGDISIS